MTPEEAQRRVLALAVAAELPVDPADLPALAERWADVSAGIAALEPLLGPEDRPLVAYHPVAGGFADPVVAGRE